jgi:hypothetical protein
MTAIKRPANEVPSSGVTVREALPQEAPSIGGMLGRAFFNDPVMRWAMPDDGRRRRILPGFFELFVRTIQRYGETYVAGDGVGAALWVPPGQPATTPSRSVGRWSKSSGSTRQVSLRSWRYWTSVTRTGPSSTCSSRASSPSSRPAASARRC